MLSGSNHPLGAVLTEGGPDRFHVMRALAAAGGHVLLIDPDSKAPLDLRSDVQRRKEDKAEQERTGNPFAEAPKGLHLATDNTTLLERYWKRATEKNGIVPNLALHVEWSGLVLVDADTANEVVGVLGLVAASGTDPATYPMTTKSPGQRNAAGEWIHRDGGHFVFVADDDTPLVHEFALPGGAKVSTHDRYFLVPPSVRPEGPYVNVGPVRALSSAPWLVEALASNLRDDTAAAVERTAKAEARAERREAGDDDLGTTITAWNDSRPWFEILTAAGWEPNHTSKNGRRLSRQRVDQCGCPTWTAPGDHADGKSATAHDSGCRSDRVELEGGSGPLQVWTDSRPAGLEDLRRKRWTKAQFVTDVRHGGNIGTFLSAEGIAAEHAPYLDPSVFAMPEFAGATGTDAAAAVSADEEEAFWASSPALTRVRAYAWSLRTSAWAVLGNVLAEIAARIPNTVALPPITGGHASLNLFVAIVGASGKGKGASSKAARSLLSGLTPVHRIELGSGEGIGHQYARRSPRSDVTERIRSSVFFTVPEIANFAALTGRQASTLSPVLCKVWVAEELGNAYVDKSKALSLEQHSYRTVLVMGVQPAASEVLLSDAAKAEGLPQRILWFPAVDTAYQRGAARGVAPLDCSHITATWPPPDPLVPVAAVVDGDETDGAPVVPMTTPERFDELRVAESIWTRLDADREAALLGEETDAALDAHRGLAWLKVAAVLSAFEGRGGHVDEDTWARAELIMRKSDDTRAEVETAVREVSTRSSRARHEAAVRTHVESVVNANEAVEEALRRRTRERVLSIVPPGESVTAAGIRRRLSPPQRVVLGEALDDLLAAGKLAHQSVDHFGQEGTRYVRV